MAFSVRVEITSVPWIPGIDRKMACLRGMHGEAGGDEEVCDGCECFEEKRYQSP